MIFHIGKIFRYNKFNYLIVFLNYVIFISSLFFFYYYFPLGFDVTDESAYFAISLKSEYSSNIFNFDLFFKKHFELTGYNLNIFRFTNLILIILSNIILCFETIRYLKIKINDVNVHIILSIFLISSISFYHWLWLPTPSYNTYNLIFCTLLSANLINYNSKNIFLLFCKILFSSFLTVLIFFSKPTSGLSLIILYFLLILFVFKNKILHFFYYIFLFLFFLLITNFYYEVSIFEFLIKFKNSIELISLKEMHGISSTIIGHLNDFIDKTINQIIFVILIAISFFSGIKKKYIINILLSFYFLIILFIGDKSSWATLIIIFNLYLFINSKKFISHKESLIPMMIAFTFVIGTANYFTMQIYISLNLLLCSFIILCSHKRNFLIILSLLINIKLCSGVYQNLQKPYNLNGPLKYQNESTNLYFNNNKFQIQTDTKTKEFIENFREVFSKENLKYNQNSFIIDMTGTLPLVNLIIPSKILEPWIGGGTEGSNKMMYQLLKRLSNHELQNSFFIFSDNVRSIPFDILEDFEIELDLVTSIAPPSLLPNNINIYKVKNNYK